MSLIKSISGIRGTIGGKPGDNLTPIDAVKFAAAYGTWLKNEYLDKNLKVVVGRDARISGSMIQNLVMNTLIGMGIDIIDVKIKDIQLPENMKRMMANQAEAERSRRARIILALAEEQAAGKLLEAGKLMDQSPSAIKLRLYQTLSNIAAEKNSTILFPFPEEVLPRNPKSE